ncbi:multicopper oxidase family protein [Roseibium aggregatum]|jgi:FtsP/CotA-like multicopper oxidase with cupredoxin domain|uniref:Multicopper oxidase mco n=1 Tax=Roseibium aggregatum TaxID=187304 RepID=A0A0M6YD68_9HYPH|nr:multicopper oxidase family protein [Roseibium aggregatum]MEC9471557.1 multicopper oxidase family protein [Pseudomonadota bacterium]CTQ47628.1 Multicopper oxidase mco [Roseibium aggregatum]
MLTRRKALQIASAGAATLSMTPILTIAKAADGFLEITAGPSRKKLYREDAAVSELWTYNGATPGPEIRLRAGETVKVRLLNNLDEPTSIHWHGIRIDNAMDGVAGLTQPAVPPGESFEYEFVVPDPGTYWYHAHNKSWNQVARGLYGALIVDEVEPAFSRGNDLTLVIDDWRLNRDGSLDVASLGHLMDWSHGGRFGNWLTVNGESRPEIRLVRGQSYRLRLINAANARIFEIDPGRFGAKILAYDGEPLEKPTAPIYAPMLLGPAQRMDLLVVTENDFVLEELSGDSPYPVAQFRAVDGDGPVPSSKSLMPNAIPEPDLNNARIVRVDMTGGAMGRMVETVYQGQVLAGEDYPRTGQLWAFNGVANLAEAPLFAAERGETIILEVVNNTAFMHAMHVHGHHFRVIERSGATIDDGDPWRDTFLVGPDQTTKIAFVADNPGKWLFHCHMLEHAAAGMNTWFKVA